MSFWPVLVCSILGLLTALVCIPFLVIRRRRDAVPDSGADLNRAFHHTHRTPVSRFGGIALACAFVAVSALIFILFPERSIRSETSLVIVLGSLAMFLLGLLDDIRPIGARKKLIGQILIAIGIYYSGVKISSFTNPITGAVHDLGTFGVVVTVMWLVALTNLINLIDGIDGLAGGIAVMLMALIAYVGFGAQSGFATLCAAGMCGALVAFLCFNFPPARIYMGDGGAYFLGFLIACLSIATSDKGSVAAALIAPLFALALPILDVSLAIVRRGLKGLPILRPDRKHLHHRLVEFGFSRRRAVLTLYSLSLIFLVLAFAAVWSQGRWVPFLFGLMCVVVLIAAGTLRFSRDWFQVGRVVGNSLEMRKETRYVLAISRWLELEAERAVSLEQLWADFLYMMKKVGFANAVLVPTQLHLSSGANSISLADELQSTRVDIPLSNACAMDFAAPTAMEPKLFELLAELSAEAWVKAVARWNEANVRSEYTEESCEVTVSLGSSRFQPEPSIARRFRLASIPLLPTTLAEITLFDRWRRPPPAVTSNKSNK